MINSIWLGIISFLSLHSFTVLLPFTSPFRSYGLAKRMLKVHSGTELQAVRWNFLSLQFIFIHTPIMMCICSLGTGKPAEKQLQCEYMVTRVCAVFHWYSSNTFLHCYTKRILIQLYRECSGISYFQALLKVHQPNQLLNLQSWWHLRCPTFHHNAKGWGKCTRVYCRSPDCV